MDIFEAAFTGIRTAAEAENECCSTPVGAFPKETPLAMAYVPYQRWERVYDPHTGLLRGTVFPALDKPFIGEEAVKNVR